MQRDREGEGKRKSYHWRY